MSIVTISRQDGSLGDEIAELLADRLKVELVGRKTFISDRMADIVNKYQLHMLEESPKFYLTEFMDGVTFKDYIEMKLIESAENTSMVVVGMAGHIIFQDHPQALGVRIVASEKNRILRFVQKYGIPENEAKRLIEQSDKKHRKYLFTLYQAEWDDTLAFDLVLNTDHLSVEQCAGIIAGYIESNQIRSFGEKVNTDLKSNADVSFKHPAEEEFARILDMYGIEWEYEPRTFPVQWDAEGNVTMAFSPDFYLTKFDTYIEITTMEQRYVTTKNKKVKRLRELYPNININIVYKRDFHTLLKRFGFSGEDEINEFNRS
ncbi:MAG: cytidylate kinase family protein [Ruminiclostridium sp.]|nr:cytidylate kinase family protein [Ruminiclostridium sp.]